MDILDKNWLTSEPIDYEFKKYKLLSAAEEYQTLIRGNHINRVIEEIEYHLSNLYKFNNDIQEIKNKLKVLKGIDIDTMSLSYEFNSNLELESLTSLSIDAINFLEKIYDDVRGKWREIEKQIMFTQIHERKIIATEGYLILITKNNTQSIYKFTKPSDFKVGWKSFKLTLFEEEIPYLIDNISSFVSKHDNNKTMIIRADVKKILPIETCLIPITSFKLFNYLKVSA
jgi:hypothetical protein